MIKRRTIGKSNSPYPAKRVSEQSGMLIFKLIAGLVSVGLWFGAFVVALSVVCIVSGEGATETNPKTWQDLFELTICKWIFGIGAILVFVGVFRSKIGSRGRQDKDKDKGRLL